MLRTAVSRPLVWFLAAMTAAAPAQAADYLQIGSQGGAQIFFNSGLPRTFNFGVTSTGADAGIDVGVIVVQLKRNAGALDPVILTLYSGLGGQGSVLATGSAAASNFSTSQFSLFNVALTSTVTLGSGAYSVGMTTASADNFFFKASTLTLTSTSGVVLSSTNWIQDTNTSGSASTSLITDQTVLAQYALGTNAFAFGNYRVTSGSSLSTSVNLVNNAVPTGTNATTFKTQALAAIGTTAGDVTISNLPSPYLSVGGTQSVAVQLGQGVTGPNSGTATLSFSSVPGTSNTTGTTAIGSGTIALSGTGWNWANATYSGTTMAFGYLHRGASAVSGTVAIGNQTVTDASYQDSLNVSGSTGNGLVTATGFSGLAATTGGATRNNLVVAAATGTAGSLDSTVALSLVSNANGVAGLSNGTATVVGTPGSITTSGTVYTGQSTWTTNGSGQWGTLASNFGTNWNWATFDGSPGVDPGFTNTDTATFGTAVTSGTATVTITSATASVRALTFSNGAASYALAGASGGALVIRGGTSNATVDVTAGIHTIAVPVEFASNAALDVATGSRLLFSGGASGTGGFVKTGGGIVEIVNSNGYTGNTVVDGGTLTVNGVLTTSDVQIGASATLMGSGTLGGDALVAGIHSPGNSPDIQTVSGSLTYQAGSSVIWELIDDTLAGRGTNYDGIDVGGALTFSGSTSLDLVFNLDGSTVDWSDAFWASEKTGTNGWLVYDGASSLSGFANLQVATLNWADGQGDSLQSVRQGAGFSTYQDGNDVYLNYSIQAVPEPSTWALLAAGAVVFGIREVRRRRRGSVHAPGMSQAPNAPSS